LKRGVLVATFSGIMSACFAYGLAAGDPIKKLTLQHGTSTLWQGLPVLVVLLAGGFATNFIWCVYLNFRNRTGREYFHADAKGPEARAPMLANYLFCALAGTTWYFQFFFYTMGETQMGRYKFSSWTLHMASIMIFSTLWGIALKEWSGSGLRTKSLVALTLLTLIGSTVIVGYGNYLGLSEVPAQVQALR
jgi:L-rhamnose-H+ transport protein